MEKRNSNVPQLLVLVVFMVFALCILAVLLTGAKSYEALVHRGETVYESRTAAQYLTTRVHQADRAGGLTVETFDGCSTLVIREEIDGEAYLTRIYTYDGFLRELFSAETGSFSPEDGEKLLELAQLSFAQQENTLSARLRLENGREQELTWYLRSREESP